MPPPTSDGKKGKKVVVSQRTTRSQTAKNNNNNINNPPQDLGQDEAKQSGKRRGSTAPTSKISKYSDFYLDEDEMGSSSDDLRDVSDEASSDFDKKAKGKKQTTSSKKKSSSAEKTHPTSHPIKKAASTKQSPRQPKSKQSKTTENKEEYNITKETKSPKENITQESEAVKENLATEDKIKKENLTKEDKTKKENLTKEDKKENLTTEDKPRKEKLVKDTRPPKEDGPKQTTKNKIAQKKNMPKPDLSDITLSPEKKKAPSSSQPHENQSPTKKMKVESDASDDEPEYLSDHICPHVIELDKNFQIVSARILDPSTWNCGQCLTTASVWACLTCGTISCGRYFNGHAGQHWKDTGHMLVLEVNSKLCHCYKCNNWVGNDTRTASVQRLRRLLEKAQYHDYESDDENSKQFQKNAEQ